jgi:hypothetical protein
MTRALLMALLILLAPSVAAAAVWSVSLTWTSNGGDGFIVQRKNAHCLVGGTYNDIAQQASAVPFVDVASPFPYACYRVRATLTGAADSQQSNEAGVVLPQSGGAARAGLRR